MSTLSLSSSTEPTEWTDSPDVQQYSKLPDTSPFSSRRGSDVDEISFKRMRDPWESVLIPEEPNPRDFNTFQDYQEAMVNWASVCIKSSNILPPHPLQLSSLIEQLHCAGDVITLFNLLLFAEKKKKNTIRLLKTLISVLHFIRKMM